MKDIPVSTTLKEMLAVSKQTLDPISKFQTENSKFKNLIKIGYTSQRENQLLSLNNVLDAFLHLISSIK